MVKSINLRYKFASENLSDRGFWDTLYVLNAMLTTLFRSQVIDITANALIEVNGISRARKNRSTYPKQLLPSPVSFLLPIGDLTKLSFLLFSLLCFAKCFFVNTLYLAAQPCYVTSSPNYPLPIILLNFHLG